MNCKEKKQGVDGGIRFGLWFLEGRGPGVCVCCTWGGRQSSAVIRVSCSGDKQPEIKSWFLCLLTRSMCCNAVDFPLSWCLHLQSM